MKDMRCKCHKTCPKKTCIHHNVHNEKDTCKERCVDENDNYFSPICSEVEVI